MAVGSSGENHGEGAVYIYKSSRRALWKKDKRITLTSSRNFGSDVDIRNVKHGGKIKRIYLAVGETSTQFRNEPVFSGAVSIHTRVIGGTNRWAYVNRAFPSEPVDLMLFGHSVALDGGDVVISATPHQVGDNGRVYCFTGVTDH